MIQPFARPPRPFPVADRSRDGEPYRLMHPRLAAIDLLREKCSDGQAGVDVYDEAIFIVDAHEHETVWVRRCVLLTGILFDTRRLENGMTRFRSLPEADIRVELNLDETRNRPTITDEPLASRGVDSPAAAEALLDAVQPRLRLLEPVDEPADDMVPLHRPALERAARAAALRVPCGCGAKREEPCGCTVGDRLASAAEAGALVDDETDAHTAATDRELREQRWLAQQPRDDERNVH